MLLERERPAKLMIIKSIEKYGDSLALIEKKERRKWWKRGQLTLTVPTMFG